HGGGYTSPTEATWLLLQEAVEPFVSDMKRQMDLGLEAEAREVCKGVLLGLYRIRDSRGDEFLGWAEDFPAEAAADAVGILARGQEGARPHTTCPTAVQRGVRGAARSSVARPHHPCSGAAVSEDAAT